MEPDQAQAPEKRSKILGIIMSVLIAAIVVGGATYYFANAKATKDKDDLRAQIDTLNKKLANANSNLTPTNSNANSNTNANSNANSNANRNSNTSTSAPNSKTSTVSTTGWNTYSNQQLGFSIKYPGNWEIQMSSESSGNTANGSLSPKATGVRYYVNISHTYLDYDNRSIDAQYNYLKSLRSANDSTFTEIPSKHAVRFTEKTKGGDVDTVLFATGKYIMYFGYSLSDTSLQTSYDRDQSIFNTVIDSFSVL